MRARAVFEAWTRNMSLRRAPRVERRPGTSLRGAKRLSEENRTPDRWISARKLCFACLAYATVHR